jgi:hypothetical protein
MLKIQALRDALGHPQSEIQPNRYIVLRAVDRDPILMVGMERTLIRKGASPSCRLVTSVGNPFARAIG